MKPSRRVPTLVLTAALGLGIWGVAFTYTPAAFSDGDVLSAAALNALLNDNFQAASDAVAGKVDLTGDSMTGPLAISATPDGGVATFFVENTGDSGFAALFGNAASNTSPAVAIKNFGTGPALAVASEAGAPLFEGRRGVSDPTSITIKADGTIENAVGSGLPLAYGMYRSPDGKQNAASTSNWTVTYEPALTRYRITIAGTDYVFDEFTTVVTPAGERIARSSSQGGDLLVYLYTLSGVPATGSFSFVTFAPGR